MDEFEDGLTPGNAWAREVATVVDPLLSDVWTFLWAGSGEIPPEVLLRMAYLQGYQDALQESERGAVLRRLGVEVPPVRRRTRSVPPAPPAKRPHGSSGS